MFSLFGLITQSGSNDSQNTTSQSIKLGKDDKTTSDNQNSESPPMFPAKNSIQRSNHTPILNIQSPDEDSDEREDDMYANDDNDQFPDINFENLSLPHSTLKKPTKPHKKVALLPGFSQLDWAKLKASGKNLRGEEVTSLRRITRSELANHKTKEDAWSSFNGKVYNITAYLNYHPGGVRELMRVAGKDGTELFMKTHAWISFDSMLDSCLLGFLVND